MADALWERFARHSTTALAARNMLRDAESSPARNASRIGNTPWNAYAYNIDFRTGGYSTIDIKLRPAFSLGDFLAVNLAATNVLL